MHWSGGGEGSGGEVACSKALDWVGRAIRDGAADGTQEGASNDSGASGDGLTSCANGELGEGRRWHVD